MDVEPLRLETGEAGGDGLETLADGIEVVQSLLEAEVGEVVGDQLVAQEGGVRRLRFFGQWDKLKADRSKEA